MAPMAAFMPDGEFLQQQMKNFWSAKAVERGYIPNEKNCDEYNDCVCVCNFVWEVVDGLRK